MRDLTLVLSHLPILEAKRSRDVTVRLGTVFVVSEWLMLLTLELHRRCFPDEDRIQRASRIHGHDVTQAREGPVPDVDVRDWPIEATRRT